MMSDVPLARQVANLLRTGVLTGQFQPGARLPSTRGLAVELGVSRNTVLEAYAQLLSEGYFEGRVGSGTFVSNGLSDLLAPSRSALGPAGRRREGLLSPSGVRLASAYRSVSSEQLQPFNPGIPALDPHLFRTWWRVAARQRQNVTAEMLNYGDSRGLRRLREAIAGYIGPARGVRCTPEQVVVTGGTQHALEVTARLLLEPRDDVWMEDPGYSGAKSAFLAAGARLVGLPVGDDGWNVELAEKRAPRARLAYVSPSHQYPLGVTMNLPSRLRLLEWAERAGAWIVEDDYDAEFRFAGRALPALHGLDHSRRVLYVGTFSKALFPALRLGYIIVPEDLIEPYGRANAVCGRWVPAIDQAALAEFIASGHFSRHLRRLRQRYQRARQRLESEAERALGTSLKLSGAPIGMHVIGRFEHRIDDREVSRRAADSGVTVPPLSAYYLEKPALGGLVLGYGHLDEHQIRCGIEALDAALGGLRP